MNNINKSHNITNININKTSLKIYKLYYLIDLQNCFYR